MQQKKLQLMNKQPTFSYLWPTLFGTFYNPDHENMKKDLLKFFEEYKKKESFKKKWRKS